MSDLEAVTSTDTINTPADDSTRGLLERALESQRTTFEKDPAEENPTDEKPVNDARARDDKGRFAEKKDEPKPVEAKAAEAPKAEVKPAEGTQEQPQAPGQPPRGWSATAKSMFAQLPDVVKAEIAKREADMDAGMKKYSGLDVWVQKAGQNNTTLPEALQRYEAAEQLLQRDFMGGIRFLCQQYQINPVQLAQALAGQRPQQQQQANPLEREVLQLKQQLLAREQREAMAQQQAVAKQLEDFFNDPKHPYAANVEAEMAELAELAKSRGEPIDLERIYQKALLINPETAKLVSNQSAATSQAQRDPQQIANQARAAAKATKGAPTGGSPPSDDADRPTSVHDVYAQMRRSARA